MSRFLLNSFVRAYCTGGRNGKKPPIKLPKPGHYKSPWGVIKKELEGKVDLEHGYPVESDITIIGGGIVGSAVAYFLKQRSPEGYTVTVIEKDTKYTQCSTVLSVGGIRQQFSIPENIQMSMFGADFLRNIKQHLSVFDMDPPDVQFNPQGYLFLATKAGADCLEKNYKLQREMGAAVEFMSAEQLKGKWPWLNTDDIEAGTYGIENEGWFDPWCLLTSFKRKAQSLGVKYIQGEVTGFEFLSDREHVVGGKIEEKKVLRYVNVLSPENEIHPISTAFVINAAGHSAGKIAELAGIGTGEGIFQLPLPVEARKRFVYSWHAPKGPGLSTPMVIDPTGVYFRKEGLGGHFIGSSSPKSEEEPPTDTLDVDYEFFNNDIWPILAHRVKGFEEIKVKSAWAGYYDYNYMDENLIIGSHPYFTNFLFCNGSSGHGLQHAPAIGRAVMELIYDGDYQSIDLSCFRFDRFIDNKPMFETNIV
ncbi:FAD-dependent oxidoreductase domain-containing protein 1-like isoform X2 [Lineus longissimus]|uniref:FAD-dependent oxidoreductase domain-containing protein 1-like isoform X2 n=1 Tax=Lineus longissimus TaxID=88925 RepID=UPI00315CEDC2